MSTRRLQQRPSLESLVQRVDAQRPGEVTGDTVPTGFASVDKILGGGLRRRDLVVLGGDIGAGKSALALGVALRVAQQGLGVAFLSGEMDEERLMERALAIEGRATVDDLRAAKMSDQTRAGIGGDLFSIWHSHVELLEKAGMLADEEAAEEIAPEHVRGAKAHVHPTDVEERLAQLDVPKKLVLLAVARKIRKKTYITMGETESAYEVVCEEYREKPRAHTQLWKYVRELDALGLIDTKLSGEGVVGKTTLISLPEIPSKVLCDNLERTLKRH